MRRSVKSDTHHVVASFQPETGLVSIDVAPGMRSKILSAIAYHPWFCRPYPAPKHQRVAHVDVALQMLKWMGDNGIRVGLDAALVSYFDLLRRNQTERLQLLSDKITLWPYQVEGAKRLMTTRRALLCDEMGLGKTLQVIAAIRPGDGVTVVCPATVKEHWAKEIVKARPDLHPCAVYGRQEGWQWPKPSQVRIYNQHILPPSPTERESYNPEWGDVDHFDPPTNRQTLIVDEAHFAKNKKTTFYQRVHAIAKPAYESGGSVYAVTATPVLNKPTDLWGVLSVAQLASSTFGSKAKFEHAFQANWTKWGVEWGKALPYVEEICSFTQIRRRKADVLKHLPAKRYRALTVVDSVSGQAEVGREIQKGMDLPQIGQIGAYRVASAKAKIPYLIQLVEEYEGAQTPLVVFSAHKAPIDALADRDGWVVITSDTPQRVRPGFIERFQSGLLKGIALTIEAGGVGITLTRAQDVVFVDRSWTPALNEQAEDRLHRIGQVGSVLVTDLVIDNGIDAAVLRCCLQKEELLESMGLDFSMGRSAA